MSLYLVTGGAGFIGSNIVEELLRRGERVRVLDNFSTGKRENIAQIETTLKQDCINNLKLDIIEGDIRSYHIVREAVDDVDFILHQAAGRAIWGGLHRVGADRVAGAASSRESA